MIKAGKRKIAAGERIRALVVDDSVIIRRLVTHALGEDPAVQVVGSAANGLIALKMIPLVNPDVVTLDIEMPEMDGIEASLAIRQKEKTSGGHIPIIALTAHAIAGDRERYASKGMDGYCSKPIRGQLLFSEIERVCALAASSTR